MQLLITVVYAKVGEWCCARDALSVSCGIRSFAPVFCTNTFLSLCVESILQAGFNANGTNAEGIFTVLGVCMMVLGGCICLTVVGQRVCARIAAKDFTQLTIEEEEEEEEEEAGKKEAGEDVLLVARA